MIIENVLSIFALDTDKCLTGSWGQKYEMIISDLAEL